MYNTKFGDYNSVMGNIIMTEQTTLEVLLSNEFGQNIPKEFQNIAPKEWAKYAFENNKEYVVTYYKEDKPYATISNTMISITISYHENRGGALFRYMHIIFNKGYIDNSLKKIVFVPYDNDKKNWVK